MTDYPEKAKGAALCESLEWPLTGSLSEDAWEYTGAQLLVTRLVTQAAALGCPRSCKRLCGRSPCLRKSFVPKRRLLSGDCRCMHFLAVSNDDFSLEGMQLKSGADCRLRGERGGGRVPRKGRRCCGKTPASLEPACTCP